MVEYGEGIMDKKAEGTSKLFVDGGIMRRRQWIHRVTLKDLKFNTKYSKYLYIANNLVKHFICFADDEKLLPPTGMSSTVCGSAWC